MNTFRTMVMACAVATALLGCTPKQPLTGTMIERPLYSVTPSVMKVRTGMVTAELSDMKVTSALRRTRPHRDAAKFTAKLKLQNSSPIRPFVSSAGKWFTWICRGSRSELEEAHTEPVIRFTSTSSSQLDPGQEETQSLEVDFPADALKVKKLKEIRLHIVYAPTAYRLETANVAVTIGSPESLASIAR